MLAPTWTKLGPLLLAVGLLSACGAASPPVPSPAASATGQATGAPASGTYTIEGSASMALYTAHETFLQQNSPFTPVGKTAAVTGTLVLAAGRFQPSTVTVDLRALKTDSTKRDRRVQAALATARYPDAVFAINGEQTGSAAVAPGSTATVKLTGTMTIHGTKQPMVWDAQVDLTGGTLHLTGGTSFKMSAFGVTPPSIGGFVSVEDGAELNVDFTAKKA